MTRLIRDAIFAAADTVVPTTSISGWKDALKPLPLDPMAKRQVDCKFGFAAAYLFAGPAGVDVPLLSPLLSAEPLDIERFSMVPDDPDFIELESIFFPLSVVPAGPAGVDVPFPVADPSAAIAAPEKPPTAIANKHDITCLFMLNLPDVLRCNRQFRF